MKDLIKKHYFPAIIFCFIISCNNAKKQEESIQFVDKVAAGSKTRILGALINGKKNGLWITLDSLGRMETQQTFLNGKEYGVINLFEEGKLVESSKDTVIQKDTVTSLVKYNYSGKVIIKGQYLNGKKYGEWDYYFDNAARIKLKIKFGNKKADTIFKDPNYVEGVR